MNKDIGFIKNIVYKLTEGKIELLRYNEYLDIKSNLLSKDVMFLLKREISEDIDVPKVRMEIEKVLSNINFLRDDNVRIYNFLLIFSELSTNILKHANKGVFTLYILEDYVLMEFNDEGKGINLDKIPYVTLTNYSSKEDSLGYGFTICSYLSKKIYINTSENGTNILVLL